MKAKLILAEAATGHPDGTVSILRAGINRIMASTPPFYLQAALVVRIETDLTDHGRHQVEVRCLGQDGKQAMPPLTGHFEVPEGGGNSTLILGISTAFAEAGRYIFYVRVDNVELDQWALNVAQAEVEP